MPHYKRHDAKYTSYRSATILIFVLSIFEFTSIHHACIPTVLGSNFDSPHRSSHQDFKLNHSRCKFEKNLARCSLAPKLRNGNSLNRILSIQYGGAQTKKSKRLHYQLREDVLAHKKDNLPTLKGGVQTNSQLLNLFRLVYITFYASLGALMPYLPVYYHSLGHSGQAIGLLGAVKPITTFLVAPIWGIVSDYIQNPNLILQLTFVTSFIFQSLLPLKNDVKFLVWIVFITALFNAPVKSLIDSMVLNNLSDEDKGQYGKLRLWGQLGFGIGSGAIGYLMSRSASNAPSVQQSLQPSAERFVHDAMDIANEAGISAAATDTTLKTALQTLSDYLSSSVEMVLKVKGYKIAFLAQALLSLPVYVCFRIFQKYYSDSSRATTSDHDKEEKKKVNISEGLNLLFHNSDALLFFFLVFIVGTASGIIENFAYVCLREVGGTGKEMGVCRLVSSLAGAPMFWFSSPLTKMFGADQVLVVSLLSFMIRFLNYALIKNPYHALPAEALRGITFAAFWSTGTVYAHNISPKGMSATMLLFMNAMYGGLGQSVGAIIGGKLQSIYGTTKTFLISAGFDFVFICLVTVYLRLRQESNFRDPTPIQAPDFKLK